MRRFAVLAAALALSVCCIASGEPMPGGSIEVDCDTRGVRRVELLLLLAAAAEASTSSAGRLAARRSI
jgi:hypothetical protein